MHRQYVEKILSSNNPSKLNELGELTIEAIDIIKDYNKDDYEDLECDLYEIAIGKVLTEEKAAEIIKTMKPYRNEMEFRRNRKSKGK